MKGLVLHAVEQVDICHVRLTNFLTVLFPALDAYNMLVHVVGEVLLKNTSAN